MWHGVNDLFILPINQVDHDHIERLSLPHSVPSTQAITSHTREGEAGKHRSLNCQPPLFQHGHSSNLKNGHHSSLLVWLFIVVPHHSPHRPCCLDAQGNTH
jgi:hypothetical protein